MGIATLGFSCCKTSRAVSGGIVGFIAVSLVTTMYGIFNQGVTPLYNSINSTLSGAALSTGDVGTAPTYTDWTAINASFHLTHRERFGFDRPTEGTEVVNVRAVASGMAPIRWADLPPVKPDREAGENGIWHRAGLHPGFEARGPGVVVEENSATLLEDGDRLSVLDDGTLEIVPQ